MADDMYNFQFQDYSLLSAHFDLNRDFKPGPDVEINTSLALTHDYMDDQNRLRLFMKVEVTGETAPLNISIEMGSLFIFEKKPAPYELTRVAEINCASILFPFAREVIADLTRRAGLAPFLIPPVNFVEFYKNNHVDESL
jgi:preprotein translocase subunit SecB